MSGLRNVLGVVAALTGKSDLQDPAAACSALVKAANSTPLNVGVGASSTLSMLHKQHPQYATAIRQQQERIAALLKRVVDAVEAGSGGEVEAALAGVDPDIRPATDFLDRVRETAEIFIDEARGQDSSQQIAALQSHLSAAAEGSGGVSSRAAVGPGSGIPASKKGPQQSWNVSRKPQAAFPDAIDNSRERPFVHKLTAKYHAHARPSSAAATQTAPHVPAAGVHPYAEELQHLAYQPQQLQVPEGAESAEFACLDDVPCAFIDSPAELQHLLTYLTTGVVPAGLAASAARFAAAQAYAAGKTQSAGAKPVSSDSAAASGADASAAAATASSSAAGAGAAPIPPTELAVDLEAHSFRSFQGFTCLMQLSTRSHDFLVDTLALRPHLHVLNRVFADPAVVKVLHGCDSDVVWLQRDFGLFLVNVFDTGQAARALGFPSAGLAYLLHTYARVTANKQYQMADWRERPLPPQMLKYAREDTHYLLGIYDRLRAELAAASTTTAPLRVAAAAVADGGGKGRGSATPSGSVPVPDLLATVLERSRELCAQQYEKESFPQDGYRRLMQRMGMLRTAPVSGHLTGVASIAASAFGSAAPASSAVASSAAAAGAGVGVGSVADESDSPRSRVFAALFDWRDAVARAEDESTGYIMPNRLLSRLAEVRPESVDALVRACNPLPALLRSNAGEVVRLVNAAVSAAAAAAKAAGAATAVAGAAAPAAGTALSGAEATQAQQQQAVGQKRRRDAAGAEGFAAPSVAGERAMAQGGEGAAEDEDESPADTLQGGGAKRPRLLHDLERSRLAGLTGAARAPGLLSSAEVLALGRVLPPPEPAAALVVKSGAGAGARASKKNGAGAAGAAAAVDSAAAGRVTSMFTAFAGSDSDDAGCAASSASDSASAGAHSDGGSGGMDVDGAGDKPLSAREAARRAAAVRASIGKMSLHDVLGLTEFYAAAAAHAAEADAATSEAASAAPAEAATATATGAAAATAAPAATSTVKPVAAVPGKLQHPSGLTEEEVTGGITSLVQRHGKGKAQHKQPDNGASAGQGSDARAAAPAAAPAFDYAAAASAVPAAANMKATLQKAVEVAAATVVPRGHNPYSKRGRGRGGKR